MDARDVDRWTKRKVGEGLKGSDVVEAISASPLVASQTPSSTPSSRAAQLRDSSGVGCVSAHTEVTEHSSESPSKPRGSYTSRPVFAFSQEKSQ